MLGFGPKCKIRNQSRILWGEGCVRACACVVWCDVWRWARKDQMHFEYSFLSCNQKWILLPLNSLKL